MLRSSLTRLTLCVLPLQAQLFAQDLPPMPPDVPERPVVEVLATDPTALRGTSSGAFTVVRGGAATNDLVVKFAVSGSGANGVDYALIQPELLIPTGFWAADVLVQPLATSPNHGNKTVTLTIETNTAAYKLRMNTRATMTIVDDAFNDVAPTVTLTSPADGTVFTLPVIVTLEATAADVDDAVAAVSFYANDRHLGRVTNSPFTLNWTNPPAGKQTLFARATDGYGKSTLSPTIDILVTNAPPVVKITSPADNAVLPQPANVQITAEISDTDPLWLARAYADGHRLGGPLTNAPFTWTWTNVPPGKHTVTVRALDVFGLRGEQTVTITVSNAPPTVTLTSPSTGATFPAGSTIALSADAADGDGGIRRVSFYANNHYLGADSTSPYKFAWKNVKAGVYSVTAVATDVNGTWTISSPVEVLVSR